MISECLIGYVFGGHGGHITSALPEHHIHRTWAKCVPGAQLRPTERLPTVPKVIRVIPKLKNLAKTINSISCDIKSVIRPLF